LEGGGAPPTQPLATCYRRVYFEPETKCETVLASGSDSDSRLWKRIAITSLSSNQGTILKPICTWLQKSTYGVAAYLTMNMQSILDSITRSVYSHASFL